MDFYSVSLTVGNLQEQFHRSTRDIVSCPFLRLLTHLLQHFFLALDDVYYAHFGVSPCRCCEEQPYLIFICLTFFGYRSFLVSSLTGLAEGGR